MAEYHTVYKGPEGETTQWEDIQVKLGNMAPKPKPWKPDAYKPEEEQQKDKQFLEQKDEQELEDLEDDFDDDRALEEYRCAPGGLLICAACKCECLAMPAKQQARPPTPAVMSSGWHGLGVVSLTFGRTPVSWHQLLALKGSPAFRQERTLSIHSSQCYCTFRPPLFKCAHACSSATFAGEGVYKRSRQLRLGPALVRLKRSAAMSLFRR